MGMSANQFFATIITVVMVSYIVRRLYRENRADDESVSQRYKPHHSQNDDLVTIVAFDLAFDAERAKAILEANEIRAFVMDANVIGLNQALTWAAGGVRLQVPLWQASHAQTVLSDSGFKSLTEIRNYHHCPKCQSTDISCHGLSKLQIIVAVLLLGALLLFLKRDFSCNECSHEWSS